MNKYILMLFLLLFPLCIVNADTIDTNGNGSINIHYEYDSDGIVNINTKIYKIANVKSNFEYEYLEQYKSLESDINNMSSSQVNEYTLQLKSYVEDNNISFDNSLISSANNTGNFDDLSVGLYLIIFDSVISDNYEYKISPTLVTIPNYDDVNNNYVYDIEMYAKVEATTIDSGSDINNNDNNKVKDDNINDNRTIIDKIFSPKTGDNIIIYIVLLFISLLGIISVVLYKKKDRKKELKDEESN